MRFHPPLDDVQLQEAAKLYRDMRSYLRGLRLSHPPRTRVQRVLLRRIHDFTQNFGRELLKPPVRIDADGVNDMLSAITKSTIDYMAAWQSNE